MLNDIYHSIDETVFSIGPFTVRWYGLGYVVGFLLGALLVRHLAKRWKIEVTWDALLTLLIACMLGAIVGGRVGYILFYGSGYYFANPIQILAFSRGGMSFHGGMIGLGLGLVVSARILKIPLLTIGDLAAISSTIGLGLVRVANFINGELWGSVTDLPWGVIFDSGGPLPRHPTQLYEAFLEGVVLLCILYMLARRKQPLPRGSYFGVFLIGYGVFRIAVEFIRQPDIQVGYLFDTTWITMGMMLSIPMVIGGIILLVFAMRWKLPQIGMEWQTVPNDSDNGTEEVGSLVDDNNKEISKQNEETVATSKKPDAAETAQPDPAENAKPDPTESDELET
jgi:phosphatidylglycerol:prolipoprotein diacylglycerol transferase